MVTEAHIQIAPSVLAADFSEGMIEPLRAKLAAVGVWSQADKIQCLSPNYPMTATSYCILPS